MRERPCSFNAKSIQFFCHVSIGKPKKHKKQFIKICRKSRFLSLMYFCHITSNLREWKYHKKILFAFYLSLYTLEIGTLRITASKLNLVAFCRITNSRVSWFLTSHLLSPKCVSNINRLFCWITNDICKSNKI